MGMFFKGIKPVIVSALLLGGTWMAQAEEIVVSNYGVSANGMPYAIAMEKGYFKEEGANVTGILSSAGGGTTLRNMLAGNAPYAEVNPNAVIAAIQQGADIKFVSDNVLTVAEFVWAVKPDSPIRSAKDLKGKKMGYTNPRSTSQGLATLIIQSGGLKADEVELVKTGGFGEGVAALEAGLVDITPMPEPLWAKYKDKYRAVAIASDILPPIANVLGAASSSQSVAKADFIKAVLRARRRAVDFMVKNPNEAGDIVAKAYNLEPAVARASVKALVESRTSGVEYWGNGQFHMEGLTRAVELQKSIGALSGDIDLAKMIDTQFLPDDLKSLK
jgi:NitT/TauT family transport system substrate-binding protein